MDVAIIDTPWNGVWQSMKIAAAAEAHEVNVAPHNFYGHLCTMMNAHFAAAVPNLRIMETDIDRLAWDHELFTHVPEFVDGHLVMPDRPGWGTEPNEDGDPRPSAEGAGRAAELRAQGLSRGTRAGRPHPHLVSRNCVGVASGTGAETVIPGLDLESVGKMAARSVSVARGRLNGIRGRRKVRLSLHAQGGSATGAMRWVGKGRKLPCT